MYSFDPVLFTARKLKNEGNYPQAIQEYGKSIEQLYESSSRPLAVFVGSGLSVPEPSSLPLSREAIVSLLNLDWVEGEEKFPIPEEQIENSDLHKMRFEHILSIVKDWGKHDIGLLLRQFADAPPN